MRLHGKKQSSLIYNSFKREGENRFDNTLQRIAWEEIDNFVTLNYFLWLAWLIDFFLTRYNEVKWYFWIHQTQPIKRNLHVNCHPKNNTKQHPLFHTHEKKILNSNLKMLNYSRDNKCMQLIVISMKFEVQYKSV